MTDRFPVPHAEHDQLLVAALAAGHIEPADRGPAEQLVATCPDCSLLVEDLRAIAVATSALPARARPRDFSLRAEDAARLRRRGWRGLVAALAGQRAAGLKPLATGLTTLGIAGLLLAAMPAVQLGLGGSASAPAAPTTLPAAGIPTPMADTVHGPRATGAPAPEVSAAPDKAGGLYAAESQEPRALVPVTEPAASQPVAQPAVGDGRDNDQVAPLRIPMDYSGAAPSDRPSPLVLLSALFLILGLGLFGLRWTARRLADA